LPSPGFIESFGVNFYYLNLPRFFKAKTLNLPSTHKRLWNWCVANYSLVEREQKSKRRVARLNKILAYGEGRWSPRGKREEELEFYICAVFGKARAGRGSR
jgi:hypothetical protein